MVFVSERYVDRQRRATYTAFRLSVRLSVTRWSYTIRYDTIVCI